MLTSCGLGAVPSEALTSLPHAAGILCGTGLSSVMVTSAANTGASKDAPNRLGEAQAGAGVGAGRAWKVNNSGRKEEGTSGRWGRRHTLSEAQKRTCAGHCKSWS